MKHLMAGAPPSADWLLVNRPRPDARVRLICFPYAGVGASIFRRWPGGLPHDVEVVAIQAPGRENRIREPAITSIPALVAAIVTALAGRLDRPFVLFGHSMGALLASEVARALHAAGDPTPSHVVVSARRAPTVPQTEPLLYTLPDAELVAELSRRYRGIPPAVARDTDLMALLLPCVRADLTALETHIPGARPPMAWPITVLGGVDDALTPRAHLDAWRAETTGPFRLRMFAGGHFYLDPLRAELLADLAHLLTAGVGI